MGSEGVTASGEYCPGIGAEFYYGEISRRKKKVATRGFSPGHNRMLWSLPNSKRLLSNVTASIKTLLLFVTQKARQMEKSE